MNFTKMIEGPDFFSPCGFWSIFYHHSFESTVQKMNMNKWSSLTCGGKQEVIDELWDAPS